MSVFTRAMGLGLRAVNRVAGSPLLDACACASRPSRRSTTARASASAAPLPPAARSRPRSGSAGPRASPALFDLTPGDEQQMLREAARHLADQELRPAAAAADRAGAAPEALLKGVAELGLAALGIPEELGGVGAERSAVTNVLVAEALAHGDLSLAVACLAPSATAIFRPNSRRYDRAEHEYPKELDMLGALLGGMNASGAAAAVRRDSGPDEGNRKGSNLSTALGAMELCWAMSAFCCRCRARVSARRRSPRSPARRSCSASPASGRQWRSPSRMPAPIRRRSVPRRASTAITTC